MVTTLRRAGGVASVGRLAAGSRGFTLIELLVAVVIIGILAALALPSYVRVKEKAKEAETKAALHGIQLAVERWGVDNEGSYPPYLIGGDNRWMNLEFGQDNRRRPEFGESPASLASDPMLRHGYVDAYPANPFVRNSNSVQVLQQDYGDPLRSTYPESRELGTRFGALGANMGSVLCDARRLTWNYIDPVSGSPVEKNTWSNVQYEFYDVWFGNRVRPFLPGSFLYKSSGEFAPQRKSIRGGVSLSVNLGGKLDPGSQLKPNDPTLPLADSDYMLGAWGGLKTKGQDILGEEPLVIFKFKGYRRSPSNNVFSLPGQGPVGAPIPLPGKPKGGSVIDFLGVPPWTRGVNRSHVGPLWGSPFGPGGMYEQLSYGNPNGVRDALVLVLTPGND